MVSILSFWLLPVNLEDPILGAHILSRKQVDFKGVKSALYGSKMSSFKYQNF